MRVRATALWRYVTDLLPRKVSRISCHEPFHIRILLNGPQDARPGAFRFAYAESPAKQRRDRDVRDIAHNPNELGRICILLAGVFTVCLPRAFALVASSAAEVGSTR